MRTHKLLAVLTLPALLALAACDTPSGVEQAAHETGTTVLGPANDGGDTAPILTTAVRRTDADQTVRPVFQPNEPDPTEPDLPAEPTEQELEMALMMVKYINDLRAMHKMQPLADDAGCATVAFGHSLGMNLHGYEGELGLDGQTHTDRMKDAGVGYTITGALYLVGRCYPDAAFEKLMSSRAATEMMLHPEMVDIGVGVRYDPNSAQGFFYTVVFRHP